MAGSVPVTVTPWVVLTVLEPATGASFTGVIVIVTVAVFESSTPSLALKVKLVTPLKFSAGVKLKAPDAEFVIATVPCDADGGLTMLYVKEGLSGSVATSTPVMNVSSGVVIDWFCAVGAMPEITLTETVAAADVKLPSKAVNVKLVGPVKPRVGVKVNAPDVLFVMTTVPPTAGCEAMLYVKVGLSTSVATRVPVFGVSLFTVSVPGWATGASLTAVTLIVIVLGLASR